MKIYGPSWQWECERCHRMSDCFDNPEEMQQEAAAHVCTSLCSNCFNRIDVEDSA